MPTDVSILKRPSQNYLLEFDLYERRHWQLMNVDADGVDGTPPAADPEIAVPLVEAFDGVTSFGTIRGSVSDGGFSCGLKIDRFPADFDQYFGVDLMIRSFHADVAGTPGAAGVDARRVRVFRGYQQVLNSKRTYGDSQTTFPIESSTGFLKRSKLKRGFDFGSGTPHGIPGTAHDIVRHLLLGHTNYCPRGNYGLYFPNHAVDTFSLSEDTLWDMLTGLVKNFVLEPWCFARREDDLYLGCHPNLDIDDLHPNKNNPIIELDDDLVLDWGIDREREANIASVTIVAQQSDQTEYVKTYPADEGAGSEGSHPKFPIRSDDPATVDALAERMYYHLNRRWTARPKLLLNVATDLADVIRVTTRDPQRNINWVGKKFVATEVVYNPVWNEDERTWTGELALDEVIE